MLIPLPYMILILTDWVITEKIKLKGEICVSNHNLLPGFDIVEYPFIINCEKNGYYLISLRTGNRDLLIQGTALNVQE